jgi:hypothetical protein
VAALRCCLAQLGPWCAAAALGLDFLGQADGGVAAAAGLEPGAVADAAAGGGGRAGADGAAGTGVEPEKLEEEVRWVVVVAAWWRGGVVG